ncbi:MAG: AraC family transcriptional regulator [Pseudomonadota bacterium]
MAYFRQDDLDTFMQRFRLFSDLSIEAAGDHYEKAIAPYEVEPTAATRDSHGSSVAGCNFGDLWLTVSHWGAPMVGTASTDYCYNIGIPVAGQTNVEDTYHGKLEPAAHEARLFRLDAGGKIIGKTARTVVDLVLPYDVLEERAKSFHNKELSGPFRFSPLLDLREQSGQSILALIGYLKQLALHDPKALNNPLVAGNLQEHVFASVLGMLAHNYRDGEDTPQEQVLPAVVRRAEEYMRANAHEPLTVAMVAKQARCSERALHNAFRRFRECSPMSMLRDIRLEAAHEELKAGEHSITETAFNWGFSNPGRFSKLYAAKFGYKPSETRNLVIV